MMMLNKRQKITLGLIVVALVVLIWQIYQLVGGGSAATSEITKPPSKSSPSGLPIMKTEQQYPNTSVGGPPPTVAQSIINASGTSVNNTSLSPQQRQYLALVNQYQMAELQRLIAADQAAIASSRYQAAQSLSKIAELSEGNNDTNLLDINLPGSNTVEDNSNYELIYTGEQNGHWTATLKKDGQFTDVTAGSVLPDGTKILAVDTNSVLLNQNNKEKLVTFNGVVPFKQSLAPAQTSNTFPQNLMPSPHSITKTKIPSAGSAASTVAITPHSSVPIKTSTLMSAAVSPNKNMLAAVSNKNAPESVISAVPLAGEKKSAVKENKPLVEQKPLPTVTKNVKSQLTPSLKNTQPAKVVVLPTKPSIAVKPVLKNPPLTPEGKLGEVAIKDFLRNSHEPYTIQLIGDNELSAVNAFIYKNQLQGKALAIKTVRNGKPWYIAVLGKYATVTQAQQAIDTLSDNAQIQQPFVKRIEDIHLPTEPT